MTFVTLKKGQGHEVFWCLCVPNLVSIHQIILQVLSGNHLSYPVALNDLSDLDNKVKVTQFKLGLCHALGASVYPI